MNSILNFYYFHPVWGFIVPIAFFIILTAFFHRIDRFDESGLVSLCGLGALLSFIGSILLIFGSYSKINDRWEEETPLKIISITSKEGWNIQGAGGGSVLGFAGQVQGGSASKYSFYCEEKGFIVKKVVDFDKVRFQYGPEPKVTPCYRLNSDRGGTTYYVDKNSEFIYTITVPEGSFEKYITISQ